MPLASTFALQWYGRAVGSGVLAASASLEASGRSNARAAGLVVASGTYALARAGRLNRANAIVATASAIALASPRGRLRARAVIGSTGLTQGDVTGAVLEALVEPGLTLKQALRLITAAMAGKVSGAGSTVVSFRNPADTKDRIVATVDGDGNRTAITTDLSDG